MAPSPAPMQPARLPHAAVPGTYRWIAPTYDLLALTVSARARRLALDWAAVQDGERVLEVAVGTGLSFRRLLEANPSGWTEGIDRTPAMLRRARRRARRAPTDRWRLGLGDAYALDVPDASFDLVLNSYLFDLLPAADFDRVLRGFYRVLRPGGRLVLFHMTPGPRPAHRLWEALYRLWPPLLGGCRGVRAAPAVERAGFEAVRRTVVTEWSLPTEVLFGVRPAP